MDRPLVSSFEPIGDTQFRFRSWSSSFYSKAVTDAYLAEYFVENGMCENGFNTLKETFVLKGQGLNERFIYGQCL